MAEEKSLLAEQAEQNAQIGYWQYRFHLSNNKPRLMFNGELPNLNRTIIPVTQNDGSETFRERSLVTSLLEVSLSQNITPTGGTFFASSQINRIDLLGSPSTTSYLSYPILVGIRQPIGSFNPFKWANKIEPLKYKISQKKYREELELSKIKALGLFFELLYAQENLDFSKTELSKADTLLLIAKNRHSVGKITDNELLKNEIIFLQSKQKNMQSWAYYNFALKQFQLFFANQDSILLKMPHQIPRIIIDKSVALERLKNNSLKALETQQRIMEMEKDVAIAKSNARLKMDLSLSFGLSKNASEFDQLYTKTQDQENIRLGFQIPVLDWQRGKAEVRVALLQKKIMEAKEKRAFAELELELGYEIDLLQLAIEQLAISKKTQEMTYKSYQMTLTEYLSGVLSLENLEKSLESKNAATQNYLKQLESIWLNYYKIRMFTLYDFEKNIPLD